MDSDPKTKQDVKGYANSRWGMTSAEIISQFQPKIENLAERIAYQGFYAEQTLRNVSIGGFNATIIFQMRSQTECLGQVLVEFDELPSMDAVFQILEQMLIAKYGIFTLQSDDLMHSCRTWRFPTTTIELSFSDITVMKMVSIRYFETSDDGGSMI
jgi:hypothetical protein